MLELRGKRRPDDFLRTSVIYFVRIGPYKGLYDFVGG